MMNEIDTSVLVQYGKMLMVMFMMTVMVVMLMLMFMMIVMVLLLLSVLTSIETIHTIYRTLEFRNRSHIQCQCDTCAFISTLHVFLR